MKPRYYISNGPVWKPTKAKTLIGAKRVARKEYSLTVGGKLEIAVLVGDGPENNHYRRVAVRYGYDNWQTEL